MGKVRIKRLAPEARVVSSRSWLVRRGSWKQNCKDFSGSYWEEKSMNLNGLFLYWNCILYCCQPITYYLLLRFLSHHFQLWSICFIFYLTFVCLIVYLKQSSTVAMWFCLLSLPFLVPLIVALPKCELVCIVWFPILQCIRSELLHFYRRVNPHKIHQYQNCCTSTDWLGTKHKSQGTGEVKPFSSTSHISEFHNLVVVTSNASAKENSLWNFINIV